jgi:hypothetical protein
VHGQRLEELQGQLAHMEGQMKEAAGVLEKRTEENYTLKQKIDG